ncbi:MAG: hypothetical protein WA624_12880 [Methylocella sp.]
MPKLDAIVRLIGAIPLEWNDEFAVRRASSMTLETLAPLRDDEIVGLPAAAAWSTRPTPPIAAIMPLKPHHATGHYPSCMRHFGCRVTEDPDRM